MDENNSGSTASSENDKATNHGSQNINNNTINISLPTSPAPVRKRSRSKKSQPKTPPPATPKVDPNIFIQVLGLVSAIIVALISLTGVIFPVIYSDLAKQIFPHTTPTFTTTPTSTFTPIPTFTLAPTATFTFAPISTPTLMAVSCPYQGQDDDQTITNLIQSEAVASNLEMAARMAILNKIFDPNALIRDFAVPDPKFPKIWRGPIAHQQYRLSNNIQVRNVEHFDIFPNSNGISGNLATYTSGSKGEYIDNKTSQWKPFTNGSIIQYGTIPATTYGSEHWILQKEQGCWKIIQFDYDAGHIIFP